MSLTQAQYPNNRSKIHPKKFSLWVGIGSLCMMFAAFTSFYLVRQAAGNWHHFHLPSAFYTSTVVILASSVALHLSYVFFKRENTNLYRGLILASLVLGILFVYFQYMGWMQLNDEGIYLAGNNASGSTIIIITALHAAHVLGGIGALVLANLHAFMLPHKVTEVRKLRFEMTYTYWHFVDILWIYLLVFFGLTL